MDPEIENPSPEIPPAPEVQPANPPAPPASAPPPPAATLVTKGEVTDEAALAIQRREAALEERERKARETEQAIADRERKAQEREEALRQPIPTPPTKTKRKRNFTDPVFSPEEVDED